MTTTHTVPQTFIDDLKRITRMLTVEAHSTDPERRANAARMLGHMKYDDERSTRHSAPRSPGHDALHQVAVAKLPVVNDFIGYSADTDHLIYIIEGMVNGLNGHSADPTPPTPISNPGDADHDTKAVSATPRKQTPTPLLLNLIRDFSQTDDLEKQQRAVLQIGHRKHDYEYALRNPNAQPHEKPTDVLANELAVIDQLIARADDDQLRNIIVGFAARIRV